MRSRLFFRAAVIVVGGGFAAANRNCAGLDCLELSTAKNKLANRPKYAIPDRRGWGAASWISYLLNSSRLFSRPLAAPVVGARNVRGRSFVADKYALLGRLVTRFLVQGAAALAQLRDAFYDFDLFDPAHYFGIRFHRYSIAAMRQALHSLHIQTRGKGLVEIGGEIALWLRQQNISTGLLTIFCRHTSASLLIQENADPDVQTDLESFFEALAPEDSKRYVHLTEGPDDMPAHIRAALSQTQLAIPVASGRMVLGTWQGVYLFEHRRAPHRREIVLHLLGD